MIVLHVTKQDKVISLKIGFFFKLEKLNEIIGRYATHLVVLCHYRLINCVTCLLQIITCNHSNIFTCFLWVLSDLLGQICSSWCQVIIPFMFSLYALPLIVLQSKENFFITSDKANCYFYFHFLQFSPIKIIQI